MIILWRLDTASAVVLISPGKIPGGQTSWMPVGVSETESVFFSTPELVGCFGLDMNAAAGGCLPSGGRLGIRPHSDGCFSRGLLPVPLSPHSPCCCSRCLAARPGRGGKMRRLRPTFCIPPSFCLWIFLLCFYSEQTKWAACASARRFLSATLDIMMGLSRGRSAGLFFLKYQLKY